MSVLVFLKMNCDTVKCHIPTPRFTKLEAFQRKCVKFVGETWVIGKGT